MPSIPKATLLTKSFEALTLFGVTPGWSISHLSHEGMKSQKRIHSQMLIEGPTDAIALKRDGNYFSSPTEVFLDFAVTDDVWVTLRASFTGPLEKVFI